MSKKQSNKKQPVVVSIKKLKTNYEVRYDYSKLINEFIKTFPREHQKVRVDNVVMPDGSSKEDWVRVIRDIQIGKFIVFLIDNGIQFNLENITKEELGELRKEYMDRQSRMRMSLKLKEDSLDISDTDYSFMKLPPYEYQKKAVKFFEINEGISILGDEMGVGKFQPLYSRIATPDGWMTMGDMKVGQLIFGRDGKSHKVLGIFPQGIKPSYRVTFSDGTHTECGLDHLWVVRDSNNGWNVMALKELMDKGLHRKGSANCRWQIPNAEACEYPEVDLIIPPYALGTSIIPDKYKFSSFDQRLEFLRVLMDVDGSAKSNRIYYRTHSKTLAYDVAELVMSLGGQAKIKIYDRTEQGKGVEYRLNVKMFHCPFSIEEKARNWWIPNRKSIAKYIISVEYVGDVEQQCIKVDSPDNTYLTDSYIVTHNTMSAISYAVKSRKKALVICPSALKLMWKDEVAKFTNEKAHIFRFFPSKKSKEINHSKEDSLFHIVNYEGISSLIKIEYKHTCQGQKMDPNTKKFSYCGTVIINLDKNVKVCPTCNGKKTFKTKINGVQYLETKEGERLDPADYDLVIIDEFHRMKNEKTDWTQIIKRSLKDVPSKLLLSGTAIKSRPIELFVPLNFLDPKTWNDKHAFAVQFCAAYEDKFGWIYDGVSNTEQLYERISPIYLRRLKKDILPELPDKTYTEIRIELESAELKAYNKIEEATKKILDDAGNVLKEVPKKFMETIHQIKQFTEMIKLDKAKDFIQEVIDSKDKVVLFFDYLQTAQRVKDLFGDNAVIHTGSMNTSEKHEAVRKFQEEKSTNVFGGTIMSAGVGITLTAANKLVFLGQAWTPSDMMQAEDRIHRASTTHDNVQIITYLCNDTMDVTIYEFIKNKKQVVSKVLDNVDFRQNKTVIEGNLMEGSLIEHLYRKLIQ